MEHVPGLHHVCFFAVLQTKINHQSPTKGGFEFLKKEKHRKNSVAASIRPLGPSQNKNICV